MSASKRNSKKQSTERYYTDIVIAAFAPSAIYLTMGDPALNQPDVLYGLDKVLLGIEVTGAYYSEEHAKGIHTQAKQTKAQHAAAFKFSIEEPDRLIRQRIEKALKAKTGSPYENVDETWLVIHQQAELSDKESTDLALGQIEISDRHPFKRKFLVHTLPVHDGRGYRVVQFFPSWKTVRFGIRYSFVEAMTDLLDNDGSIWVPPPKPNP
jgi:hypothetical protein